MQSALSKTFAKLQSALSKTFPGGFITTGGRRIFNLTLTLRRLRLSLNPPPRCNPHVSNGCSSARGRATVFRAWPWSGM
jgi:hypothetical protein